MADNSIYSDIKRRTGGDIYVGVVGPVRTGKSTFIRKFLETVVLPNIKDDFDKARCEAETPQAASGRTVMTTEPKFVPDESVRISVGDGTELNVKLVDCVGYMVKGALGQEEDGATRMVKTPWLEEAIPFSEAAELGTAKVIGEHSTIGILVTSDGSFGEIPREDYIEAEERVAKELTELRKPFCIVLNSQRPSSRDARMLAEELEAKYSAPVALVSCPELSAEDISVILEMTLGEFPARRIDFRLPSWLGALPEEHPLHKELGERIKSVLKPGMKLGDVPRQCAGASGAEFMRADAGEGVAEVMLPVSEERYCEIIGEVTGFDVSDKEKLFNTLKELSLIKAKYERISEALEEAERSGYGIVMPRAEEMTLEEPRAVKTAGGYGVRVLAHAETIHMIKTGIKADLCPMVGTEEQTEEVVRYLRSEFEESPERIWESNMLGRSLYDLVKDGMAAKLTNMPEESRTKLGETLERIINEGANGLICILL
ncbi:MAG: stage IV sporulation protein A [Clostridia bacterium]|nr:stage IV sporulation protein A [Clostridia bacterium]